MKKLLVLMFVMALQMPAVANVTTGTWYLDQSNTFAGVANYGQVDISADSVTGVVSFTVDAFIVPAYGTTTNFGIQSFGFNTDISGPVSSWTLPSGWSTGSGNQDGFGSFDFTVAGSGSDRLDPLTFQITLLTPSDAVASSFAVLSSGGNSVLFAAHAAGFDAPGGAVSNWIGGGTGTPTVPAPGAILLGGIGVVAVGWMRRKQMH